MLVAAAAKEWSVPEVRDARRQNSVVTHKAAATARSYGELADKAAALPVPDAKTLKLKDRKDFTLARQAHHRCRQSARSSRVSRLFGIDQVVPGMQYAVFEKCPAVGGKVKEANLEEIRKLPGVTNAFVVEGTGKPTEVMPGVAILANSTWAAFSAQAQTEDHMGRIRRVEGQLEQGRQRGARSSRSSKARNRCRRPATSTRRFADANARRSASTPTRSSRMRRSSRRTRRPRSRTAQWRSGRRRRRPTRALRLVAGVLGIPVEKVTIHQTRVGGGFGRRLMNDYMCEAARISKQAGVPVKLQWTREDDMQHDFYRVGGFHSFKGGVDQAASSSRGRITSSRSRQDGQKPASSATMSARRVSGAAPAERAPDANEAAARRCRRVLGARRVPARSRSRRNPSCTNARSPAKRDHLRVPARGDGRAALAAAEQRVRVEHGPRGGVIKLAAEKAGWGKTLPKGRGLGLAFHFSHAGHFAEVAEVSVDANRKLTLHKVTVAGDIGPVINMSGAENQVRGLGHRRLQHGAGPGDLVSRTAASRRRTSIVIRFCAWRTRRRSTCISSRATSRPPASANRRCRRWRLRSATRSSRRPDTACARCRWARKASRSEREASRCSRAARRGEVGPRMSRARARLSNPQLALDVLERPRLTIAAPHERSALASTCGLINRHITSKFIMDVGGRSRCMISNSRSAK